MSEVSPESDELAVIYTFGPYELDARLYRLRKGMEEIRLQPKVFSVLHYLIRHRDRVVSKQELFDAIWPDETLTESVLARTIAVARKALGQRRGERQPIETDYGRGYRFTATVSEREAQPGADGVGGPGLPPSEADPFVGRDHILQRLLQRLVDADAGVGRLCLLVGEAGIGKTRAAEELCAQARVQGAMVLTGLCFEGEGAPALWPWIQVLRELVRQEDAATLERYLQVAGPEIVPLLPELASLLPGSTPRQSGQLELEAAEQRFRLLDGIVRFLMRAAEDRLRVVFLDDLHWADPTSLQLLGFLVRGLAQARILVVGTMRDPELSREHPVRTQLDQIVQPRVAERMRLSGLEEADVESFIRAATGKPVPEGLVEAVYARTEGNPLFMREALRLLTNASGQIAPKPVRDWQVELPDVARDVIRRRIAQADDEVQSVLRAAAVMGRDFDLPIVAAAVDIPRQALLDVLGDAEVQGLVDEDGERIGHYRFAHIMIRDTLYDDLAGRERVQLHKAIAEALERHLGTSAHGRSREIAHHYLRALPDPGVIDKAVTYAEAAASAAREVFAYEEATQLYQLAIDALAYKDDADLRKRYSLYHARGATAGQAGQVTLAVEAFWEATKVARALEDPALLGWAALALGIVSRIYYRPSPEVDALVSEALEQAPPRPRTLRALLLLEKAGSQTLHDPERRRAYLEKARSLFDEPNEHVRYRFARAKLLVVCGPHQLHDRLEALDELLEVAASREDLTWLEFDARRLRATTFVQLADMVRAHREVALCAELVERYNMILGRWGYDLLRMGLMLGEGRLDEVDRLRERVIERGRAFQSAAAEVIDFTYRFQLAQLRGELDSLRDVDVQARFEWAGDVGRLSMLGTLCQLGRGDEARAIFRATMDAGLDRIPRSEDYLTIMASLCLTAFTLGDRAACAPLYEAIVPYEGQILISSVMSVIGPVSILLGGLRMLEGDWESARRHYAQALDLADGLGLVPSAIRARLGLASAYDRLAGKHHARARALRREAAEDAERIGATGLLAAGPADEG